MKAHVGVSTVIEADYDLVWSLLQRSNTLFRITDGQVEFLNAHRFPETWSVGETYDTQIQKSGSRRPFDYQFAFTQISKETGMMRTVERGGPIKRWVHSMYLERHDEKLLKYTDIIVFDVGWRTWPGLHWLAEHMVYQYYAERQERLIKLIGETAAKNSGSSKAGGIKISL